MQEVAVAVLVAEALVASSLLLQDCKQVVM